VGMEGFKSEEKFGNWVYANGETEELNIIE
jgi:hypothetical protein